MLDRADLHIDALQREFETATPEHILRWATDTFGSRLAIITSFQPSGIVTMHLMSQIAPRTPVITLDTGLLFPETYALIDELEARLHLNLIRVRPEQTVQQQAEQYGDALWERNPEQCCHLRKVVPLGKALDGYAAWISGIRRDQSPQRASAPIIAWEPGHQRIKLNPVAAWSEQMIWGYLTAHDLPYNKLHDQGYPSIGCKTCTLATGGEGYSREGRWSRFGKTECGIHLPPGAAPSISFPIQQVGTK